MSHRFRVTGNGQFPLDLLRLQRALPASANDSIKASVEYCPRSIELTSDVFPSAKAWNQYGWRVDYLNKLGTWTELTPMKVAS